MNVSVVRDWCGKLKMGELIFMIKMGKAESFDIEDLLQRVNQMIK